MPELKRYSTVSIDDWREDAEFTTADTIEKMIELADEGLELENFVIVEIVRICTRPKFTVETPAWDSVQQPAAEAAPFRVGERVEACRTRKGDVPVNFEPAEIVSVDSSHCPYEVKFRDGSRQWRFPDGVRRPATVAARPQSPPPLRLRSRSSSSGSGCVIRKLAVSALSLDTTKTKRRERFFLKAG